jgi:hypothetical protein
MPRRLIAAAVAGVAALVALAGCRIESPTDAAYVGNTRFSQADVDKLVKQLDTDGVQVTDANRASLRQFILARSVFLDVAKRYATEKGYAAPPVDAAAVAQANNLPANDPVVRLVAESDAYRQLLLGKASPAQPTDADYHDAFQLLVNQKEAQPGDEAALTQQLRQSVSETIASGVGLRNELAAAMRRYGATVNPKYLPTGFPLATVTAPDGRSVAVVQLPLGGTGQGAVLDLPVASTAD